MSVGERLKRFRESRGLSQSDFADAIDTAFRTYQDYERDKFSPKLGVLERVAALGCDLNWLVTGQGSPDGGRQAQPPATLQDQGKRDFAGTPIPVYDAKFSAGGGIAAPESLEQRWITIPEQWLRRISGRNPSNLIIASAVGDSMAPTIADGDDLLIDHADQRLVGGKIYALSVDGQLVVKRIHRPATGGVVLLSDNEAYPADEIPVDRLGALNIIGQVVWYGRTMG